MSAIPEDKCNPFVNKNGGNATFEIIIGCVFTFGSLIVMSASTQKQEDKTLTNDLATGIMEKEEDTNTAQEDIEDPQ